MARMIQPTYYGYQTSLVPQALEVHQAFGNHTVVVLDYSVNKRSSYVLPPEKTPVSVTWGTTPNGTKTFYGYVNHYVSDSDSSGIKSSVKVVVLGTSKDMNTAQPTTWQGATRSGVAREIAKRHRLRSVIHPHPVVLETWTTGLRTDFQALQELASESGYRVWVDGATLYFLDPDELMLSSQNQSFPEFFGSDIRDAKLLGGSGAPIDEGVATRKVVYGLDYHNNEFFEAANGNENDPVQVLPVTASAYYEADSWLDAAQKQSSAYYNAELILSGNSDIYPGNLILLGNTKTTTDLSGYWVVLTSTHDISQKDYVTRVNAIRGPDQTPNIRTTGTIQGAVQIMDCVIRDGSTWEATYQEHINV